MLSFYDYCIESGNTALISRWDFRRNGSLTPADISYGSHRRICWRCEKGHEWEADICYVAQSSGGCPVCAGKSVVKGYNDLKTQHPELARQWNTERNGSLTPEDVTSGSTRKVWWRCEKGHEWQTPIKTRAVQGASCPYCANKLIIRGFNDLAALYPELAAQWDRERNGALEPENVFAGSNRRVWWRCEKGHAWQAVIGSRTNQDSGCPYCTGRRVLVGFNDLATVYPTIANQWHPALNGELKPTDVTPGCNKRVWWICEEGHIWKTKISARTAKRKRTACPVCGGCYSHSTLYKPEKSNEPPQGVQK